MSVTVRNRSVCLAALIAFGVFVVTATPLAVANPPLIWVDQFGTIADDAGFDVAVDASGIYVVSTTAGTFPGQTNAGQSDAFIQKVDSNGNGVWTRQFGTSGDDTAEDVAVDASGVYVAGRAEGVLPGQSSAGPYIRKYDANGNVVWTRQFGPLLSNARGVAVGASGVYVVGTSEGGFDAFIRKYDTNGNFYWVSLFGISDFDDAYDVAVDGSGEYVVGSMQNGAQHYDAFLWKFDTNGAVIWTRLFGSQPGYPDAAYGVAFDSSGVCVGGT